MNIEKKINEYRKSGFPYIWVSDLKNGEFRNPVLHTDFSDPDAIRVGDDFFMTASSFNNAPGLPILHSKDLINWTLINYAAKEMPLDSYKKPRYGRAVWAPSIRYHNGFYYIYVGFPDEGIYMTRTTDPYGEWEPLRCIKPVSGWIDTCPLWDDDGSAYLVNAFARSRIGFKSVLAITRMSPDGLNLEDEFRIVYDGNEHNPTIEGPKFYKRNGYYYISAPAGGVKDGWQLVLRSKNIYGPYEEKIVLHQGDSVINGPHQGALVDLENGEEWFMHFQDKGAYGRIVHLQPVKWVDGWPLMGCDTNGDGIGEPVLKYKKPSLPTSEVCAPAASDDFESSELGLQWQWNANPQSNWYSISGSRLRLYASNEFYGEDRIIWNAPHILTLKFPALKFTATVKMELSAKLPGEKAGIVIMGRSYCALTLTGEAGLLHLTEGRANKQGAVAEWAVDIAQFSNSTIYLRVEVSEGAICRFSYSADGESFIPIGGDFAATVNEWVGAKLGLFCTNQMNIPSSGYADFDWVLIEENE